MMAENQPMVEEKEEATSVKEEALIENTADSEVKENTATGGDDAVSTDWKAEARKWEARAKSNLKAKEKLENQLLQIEAEKAELAHSKLISQIAADKGVDSELLHGESKEEIEQVADRLLAWREKHERKPAAPVLGLQPNKNNSNTAGVQFLRTLMNKE
ncbi:hypothetical protein R6G85_02430 [Actinotignum urinale]|uniref:Helicase n=1 Tax=Actinotignum urinale TaxID=190146 RepID=A0ABU5G4E3_9ACTO|nr:hypothetical protein [Actinotignum urinale]MDY5132246.1 hypothetical protein [Actinotignum urinale]MDY5151344.1 hypothetical protein [Actinotignum urinale]WIK58855.1 hypothetical protein CJ184_006310 [Actinotignum urinale]